jgi:hypothetical protein
MKTLNLHFYQRSAENASLATITLRRVQASTSDSKPLATLTRIMPAANNGSCAFLSALTAIKVLKVDGQHRAMNKDGCQELRNEDRDDECTCAANR